MIYHSCILQKVSSSKLNKMMQKTNHRDKYLPFLQALLIHPSTLILPSLPFSNDSDPSTWHTFDCPVYQTMKNFSIPHKLLWLMIWSTISFRKWFLMFQQQWEGFFPYRQSHLINWTFRKSSWGFEGLKDSVSENDMCKDIWMLADNLFLGNYLVFQDIHFYHQSAQSIV